MKKGQWSLFNKIFKRSSELQKKGLRRKESNKVIEKEFGDNKYFVKKENQPTI